VNPFDKPWLVAPPARVWPVENVVREPDELHVAAALNRATAPDDEPTADELAAVAGWWG